MSYFGKILVGAGNLVAQVPDPRQGQQIPGIDKLNTLVHWVFVVAGLVALAGIIGIGAKMAISHSGRGGDDPNIGALGKATAGCVLISVAAGVVNLLLA